MEEINIVSQEETETGWKFIVEVGNPEIDDDLITFNVNLDEDYFDYLTEGILTTPEDLIEKTFEYLLEREDKESIMRRFDLDSLSAYYDDYESEVVKKLQESS